MTHPSFCVAEGTQGETFLLDLYMLVVCLFWLFTQRKMMSNLTYLVKGVTVSSAVNPMKTLGCRKSGQSFDREGQLTYLVIYLTS